MTTREDILEDAIMQAWLDRDAKTGREDAHRGLAQIAAKAVAALSPPEPTEGPALHALRELDLLIDFGEPCSDDKPMIFSDWSDLNKAFELAHAVLRSMPLQQGTKP